MTDPNAIFDGSMPVFYDRHLGPLLFEPYAADLVRRISSPAPARALELACGTGIVTKALRSTLPQTTELVATDLSGAMLAFAHNKFPNSPTLIWRVADAGALPFANGEFELVVCQFGLMFVPDKAAAIRETRRVLRPGGKVLFSVWDSLERNPLCRVAHEIITGFFPERPPDFYQIPFSLHDRPALEQMFVAGGFSKVRVETVALEGYSPSARYAATGLVLGNPTAVAIRERGMTDPSPIINALTGALERLGGGEPFRAPTQAIVIAASVV